jgi:valyl-tRNA synthetase
MNSKDNADAGDDEATLETKATASAVLAGTLRLLHPFMPYLTEELNEKIFNSKDLLIGAAWPEVFDIASDDAVDEVHFIISLISEIRYIRTEMNVPLSAKPALLINGATALQNRAMANQQAALLRIARLETVTETEDFGNGCAQGRVDGLDIALPLADILDLAAEAARLNKEISAVTAEIEKIARKLDNPGFIAKAPDDVIVENRRRLEEENVKREGLNVALSRLR